MSSASLNGIEVYFERRGTGAPVLFLNGSGATLAAMGLLLDVLATRCELLAHDQRGLGRTEAPRGPYTMADYAADAVALLDHVGWERARVVGISFGGMVAQELAVTRPDRVERLALLCTSPGGVLPSYPLHELAGLEDAERAREYLPLLDTRFTPEWLADPTHESDRNLVAMLAGRTAGPKSAEVARGEREQLEARRRHDVLDRFGRIACPTLVAAGRYDGIAPLANSEAIAARIPGAELRVYDGGHAFFAQDGRALPDVLDFLTA
ncbi:MAG: alpha/beta fold hydrolase [Acidimicrobiia bacterium]